jgi:hypothetical protein
MIDGTSLIKFAGMPSLHCWAHLMIKSVRKVFDFLPFDEAYNAHIRFSIGKMPYNGFANFSIHPCSELLGQGLIIR